ncbi:NAD(P)H-dependent oxidoreductase [Chryseobacterium lactis]|uniref:NAD(P)H-dependent oxidoreductase n=1 Tax=Chryseobacterium lactis TaxID=1241981 RepID=A0A3G6RZT3_CHRLC|nr:NAD(P)H-dependent oxidoreductase [Chryseobacterium lactis]AZA85200.1 NAD(P)H-dependent oxidoreductase [Chryseobacterium lactis]AZB07150.1 NAD(P)H-dependent oxidoreductase [Chryseobacterium lactis]PNW11731.1 NAD(P)H-dependent oxidoreductase [Chryseobacterium lactis]
MSLQEALNWRSATKSYNGKAIEKDKIEQILEAIRLAPTSSGLQPFKVFVITNKELREKLQPISYQQQQIVQASHILVFAAWDQYTTERVDSFFEFSNKERDLPSSATDDYRLNLLDMLDKKTTEEHFANASRQAYLALGFGLLAAADLKIDATPLEGFDNQAVDELLNLPEQGLRSSVMMALGYKDEDKDWWGKLKKIRRSSEELFVELH